MFVKVIYVRSRAQPTLHQCVPYGLGGYVCVGGNRREILKSPSLPPWIPK